MWLLEDRDCPPVCTCCSGRDKGQRPQHKESQRSGDHTPREQTARGQGSGAHWECGFYTSLTALTHSRVSKELPPALCDTSCCPQHGFNCTIPLYAPERLAWLGMIARTPAHLTPSTTQTGELQNRFKQPDLNQPRAPPGFLLAIPPFPVSIAWAMGSVHGQKPMATLSKHLSPILPPFRTAYLPTRSTQRTQTLRGSRQAFGATAAAFGSSFSNSPP